MSRIPRVLSGAALLACVAVTDTAADILVFAASSLRSPLSDIAARWSAMEPEQRVQLHAAGSGALTRQIAAGAPCDVFVGASWTEAVALRAQGWLVRLDPLASNRLVVFTRHDFAGELGALADLDSPRLRRIAIGDPRSAPVGEYAMQALGAAGLDGVLQSRLLPSADAVHVTAAVATGNADAGIAYHTDVLHDSRLRTWFVIAESLHAPVTYAIAVCRDGDNATATRFVDFARGPVGAAILQRHGFALPADDLGDRTPARSSPALATRTFSRASRLQPLWLSLRVAVLATLAAGAFGMLLAARLASARPGVGRDLAAAITDLPMVLPPTVVGVLLLEALTPQRALGAWLERAGIQITFTWIAAVVASAIMALPLMVRPARSALESVPRRYLQAARSLGASPWRSFWQVQLPLARRGVLAGVLLAFFRALGEFGATLMVAGNIPGRTQTMPLAIYDAVFFGSPGEALAWVGGVMVLTLSGAFLAQRLAARDWR